MACVLDCLGEHNHLLPPLNSVPISAPSVEHVACSGIPTPPSLQINNQTTFPSPLFAILNPSHSTSIP